MNAGGLRLSRFTTGTPGIRHSLVSPPHSLLCGREATSWPGLSRSPSPANTAPAPSPFARRFSLEARTGAAPDPLPLASRSAEPRLASIRHSRICAASRCQTATPPRPWMILTRNDDQRPAMLSVEPLPASLSRPHGRRRRPARGQPTHPICGRSHQRQRGRPCGRDACHVCCRRTFIARGRGL